MERIFKHSHNPLLYSELSIGHCDFIELAERCELLTQIILDCDTVESAQPVCRCLVSYLEALTQAIDRAMPDYRIVELTVEHLPDQEKEWLFSDSEILCEYCLTLAGVLSAGLNATHAFSTLAGLLHDLVSYMASELKAPRFTASPMQPS